MSNGKIISEYSVKLTSFQLLGGGIIFMSIIYFLNDFGTTNEVLSRIVSLLIIDIIVGGFFLYFGNKKRALIIYENGVVYKEGKVKFEANWDDIILLKSFQEMGKSASNLIIMKENEDHLSISSAFFKIEYLIAAFKDVQSLNIENITVEDDLNWNERS